MEFKYAHTMKKNYINSAYYVIGMLLCLVTIPHISYSQKKSKEKKEDKIEIYSTILGNGSIEENKNLRGYYVFKAVDKVYGKQQNYHIELFDENFTELNTIKFKDVAKLVLLSSAYSSEELCFMFLNNESKSFEYKVFSIDAKLISEFSSKLSRREYKRYMKYATKERVVSLDGGGFLSTSTVTDKRKITFKLNKFIKGENKPKEYRFTADKKINLPTILGVNNNTIILTVKSSKKQGGNSKYHILGINQETMKETFHLNSDQDGENLFVPYSLTDNPDFKTIKLSGTFFKPNSNTTKASKGLAMWELDSTGLLLSERYNNWSADFNNTLRFKNNGKAKNIGFLKVHETFSTKDGKTFAVTEGYRKQFNGWGLFTLLIGWPSMLSKYQTTDLVLFEMDKEFKVKRANVFPKNKASWAAYGMSTAGVHSISNLTPYMFGYNYVQLNEERDAFMITFDDNHFKRTAFNKKKYSFNTIKWENGKLTTDKLIPEKQGWFSSSSNFYMPNQFGKIAYYTYDYKTKKSEFRIIKVK